MMLYYLRFGHKTVRELINYRSRFWNQTIYKNLNVPRNTYLDFYEIWRVVEINLQKMLVPPACPFDFLVLGLARCASSVFINR